MNKYFFPTQDSFITNDSGYENKNFGMTEILKVGTVDGYSSTTSPFTSQSYNEDNVNITISGFYGTIGGSLIGQSDFFDGDVYGTSASINVSYFSGSIDNNPITLFSGSIVSSSFIGIISSSVTAYDYNSYFSGSISNFSGSVVGELTGYGIIDYPLTVVVSDLTAYRSLIKFDLTAISQSVVNAGTSSSSFYLNLKVCDELELPLNYAIYAFAVSQSWTMGTGYLSDGGSSDGVSWQTRDGVSSWSTDLSTIHSNISLTDSASADGGGTWYSSSICSQSFGYSTSDLSIDITSIVTSWLDGEIPNEGIMLMASSEVTGTAFTISYFSENTNTIYSPYLNMGWNSFSFVTGSTETSSVNISFISESITGITTTSSYFLSSPIISGTFSGSAGLNTTIQSDPSILSASGIVFGTGLSGNIINLPFIGGVSGVVSADSVGVTGSCGNMFDAQLITASFTDGIWQGMSFTAYYVDNMVENAILSGSFPNIWLADCNFSILNLSTEASASSYYMANLNGDYMSGNMIGKLSFYNSGSASYDGFFTSGLFNGLEVVLPFSGSIYTSSFSYTSSIDYTSSVMSELDISHPFNVNVKDLNYKYQRGNVIKIYISSAEKYPSKNFNVGYQFDQYTTPNYLPTSSYYGIRDNITNEMVVDFDNYTQINCDYPLGNYFELDTNCLFPEREYQILIKILDTANSYTLDTGKKFKIVR